MQNDYFLKFVDEKLLPETQEEGSPSLAAQYIHTQFRTLAMHPQFPFPQAQTAFQKGNYHFGVFKEMENQETTKALKSSLDRWIKRDTETQINSPIFVSCYQVPIFPIDQAQLSFLLRQMLQNLDVEYLEETKFGDAFHPEDIDFSFCYQQIPCTVASLYSGNPFFWRRFGWPSLIFTKIGLDNKN